MSDRADPTDAKHYAVSGGLQSHASGQRALRENGRHKADRDPEPSNEAFGFSRRRSGKRGPGWSRRGIRSLHGCI